MRVGIQPGERSRRSARTPGFTSTRPSARGTTSACRRTPGRRMRPAGPPVAAGINGAPRTTSPRAAPANGRWPCADDGGPEGGVEQVVEQIDARYCQRPKARKTVRLAAMARLIWWLSSSGRKISRFSPTGAGAAPTRVDLQARRARARTHARSSPPAPAPAQPYRQVDADRIAARGARLRVDRGIAGVVVPALAERRDQTPRACVRRKDYLSSSPARARTARRFGQRLGQPVRGRAQPQRPAARMLSAPQPVEEGGVIRQQRGESGCIAPGDLVLQHRLAAPDHNGTRNRHNGRCFSSRRTTRPANGTDQRAVQIHAQRDWRQGERLHRRQPQPYRTAAAGAGRRADGNGGGSPGNDAPAAIRGGAQVAARAATSGNRRRSTFVAGHRRPHRCLPIRAPLTPAIVIGAGSIEPQRTLPHRSMSLPIICSIERRLFRWVPGCTRGQAAPSTDQGNRRGEWITDRVRRAHGRMASTRLGMRRQHLRGSRREERHRRSAPAARAQAGTREDGIGITADGASRRRPACRQAGQLPIRSNAALAADAGEFDDR